MVPDVVDSAVLASVDAELIGEVGCLDVDVALMREAVSKQVVGLLLLVVLVVRSDNVDFLPQSDHLLRQLIDHDSQTTHCAPAADLRSHEGDGTEGVAPDHVDNALLEVAVQLRVFADQLEHAEDLLQFVLVDVEFVVFADQEGEVEIVGQDALAVQLVKTLHHSQLGLGGTQQMGQFVEED